MLTTSLCVFLPLSLPPAGVQTAEAAALEATKKFGVSSPEARLAWDEYEEVAAADNSIATRVTLDEDCDVSLFWRTIVLSINKNRLPNE